MTKVTFNKYFNNIRKSGDAHIYIEQDFAYDDFGIMYLTKSFKTNVIVNNDIVFNVNVLFGSFGRCEEIALRKCGELDITPKYIVYDKQRHDPVTKDIILKVVTI